MKFFVSVLVVLFLIASGVTVSTPAVAKQIVTLFSPIISNMTVEESITQNLTSHGTSEISTVVYNRTMEHGDLILHAFAKDDGWYNNGYLGFYYDGNESRQNAMRLGFNGADYLLNLNSYGYLGIGQVNPKYALDVWALQVATGDTGIYARFANSNKQRFIELGQKASGALTQSYIQAAYGSDSTEEIRVPYDLLINPEGGGILMPNLPTSDPHVIGQLWNNNGVLSISN